MAKDWAQVAQSIYVYGMAGKTTSSCMFSGSEDVCIIYLHNDYQMHFLQGSDYFN